MKIIAFRSLGFPSKQMYSNIIHRLREDLPGTYQLATFDQEAKTWYVRTSQDPLMVIDYIKANDDQLRPFIPKNGAPPPKPQRDFKKQPFQKQKRMNDVTAASVFVYAHSELLTEIQIKFTGLYNLSKKTGHKLLNAISEKIMERLHEVVEKNARSMVAPYVFSKAYRLLHPHFTDFQLILSTLHRLQDEAGAPRALVLEKDLCAVSKHSCLIENIPYDKLRAACNKYSDKIVKKLSEHVSSYELEHNESDTPEQTAQKRVRLELKKLQPYYSDIVQQVITLHFKPQKAPFQKFRIYGEPSLPSKIILQQALCNIRTAHVARSDRIHNLLKVSAPLEQYAAMMKLNNTTLGDCKLVVRSSHVPMFPTPKDHVAAIRAHFGDTHTHNMDVDDHSGKED